MASSDGSKRKRTAKIEVGWPVPERLRGTREIKDYDLPCGKMAHVIHHCLYESCEPTYLKLFTGIKENGFRISAPIREVYPNDPRVVPPDPIITEIFVPVN